MKAPFAYFGGKMGMAREIVALMPRHRTYIEPFLGSGAVLLAKPAAPFEVVNDVDHALVTFWRVLRTRQAELEQVCALTPHSRAEYDSCDLDEPGLDELELARRWWVRVNQSFGCTANRHTGWSISNGTQQSKSATIVSRLGRFAPVAERIARVSIECCDAVGLSERLADHRTVVYCDPPYLADSRVSRAGNGGDYRFDMGAPQAHRRLAVALNATPARVILSGYPTPLYDEIYRDWSRIDRAVTANSSNMAKGPRALASRVESIWTNFDPQPMSAQFDFEEASS